MIQEFSTLLWGNSKRAGLLLLALAPLFWITPTLAASNQSLVYQGRVVRPDGTAPNTGSLTFTLSVYSPSPSKCLLYSETQIVSMVGSQGMFSLQLGAGSRVDGGSHTFNQVFTNGATLTGLTCADGSTSYTAGATEDRSLSVSFNDAGTVVNLSAMAIKSVPFALQAHEVDGWGLNNLVKVSSIGSPTTFTTSEMANVKSVGAAACATNEILKWNGSAWLCSTDVSAGSPSDATYASKGIFQADTDAATSGLSFSASGVLKVNFGTGANQIVKLDASSKLPAVNGSALTGLSVSQISSGTLSIAQGGTGASTKTAAFDALSPLTTKGDVIVFDGTNNIRLPAGSNGQVLTADSAQASGVKWAAVSSGSVTSVTAGTGLSGGTITSTGTLSVDAGTGANQIVQLDASSKLPAVDGSALTNLSATQITSGTLPVSRGGTGTVSFAANNLVGTNGTGTALQAVTCTQNQIISFDASGNYGCYNLSSIAGSTYFAQNGNSFGAAAVLGTNDNNTLSFETNNSTRMSIDTAGNVGIGITAPSTKLHLRNGGITLDGGQPTLAPTIYMNEGFPAGTSGSSISIQPWLAGNVTTLLGVDINAVNLSGFSVTNYTGLRVSAGGGVASGNNRGVEINSVAAGASNYALYSSALAQSYFAGDVGIGTSSPSEKLEVNGSAKIVGSLFLSGASTALDLALLSPNITAGGNSFISSDSSLRNYSFGNGSTASVSPGVANLAVGYQTGAAWFLNSGSYNSAIGFQAGYYIGGSNNTAVGTQAMGSTSFPSSGNNNSAFGGSALFNVLGGSYNTALGDTAGYNLTNGSKNIFLGYGAGASVTTGSANVVIGGNNGGSIATLSNYILISDGAGTERMRINNSGYVGIGTTNPGAPLDVKSEIRMTGATSGYAGLKSPAVGPSVTWTLPTADGSAGQFLKTDGSGNLSWASASGASITSMNGLTGSTQTFATATTGTDFTVTSSGSTHTFAIPDSSATARGLLTSTDWSTFNSKLGTSTSFAGDVTGAYNSTTVSKIQNTPVSFASLSSGNYLKYNGSGWVNANPSSADITAALGYTPVNRAGDTMSGSLTISSPGTDTKFLSISHDTSAFAGDVMAANMAAGSGSFTGKFLNFQKNSVAQMTVDNSGNLALSGNITASGSATISGDATAGAVRASKQVSAASFSGSSNAIDWNNGNVQSTSADCQTLSFANMLDGGTYTMVVTDAATTGCVFPASINGGTAVSWRGQPTLTGHVRTASTHTVYTMLRVGSIIYVSWITGF